MQRSHVPTLSVPICGRTRLVLTPLRLATKFPLYCNAANRMNFSLRKEMLQLNFQPEHRREADLLHWDSGNLALNPSQLGSRRVALGWPRGICGLVFQKKEEAEVVFPKSVFPMLRLRNNLHFLWRKSK